MTPTELKEAAKVMAAAAEGKEIEFRNRGTGNFSWWNGPNETMAFDWNCYDYRIKREPLTAYAVIHRCGNKVLYFHKDDAESQAKDWNTSVIVLKELKPITE